MPRLIGYIKYAVNHFISFKTVPSAEPGTHTHTLHINFSSRNTRSNINSFEFHYNTGKCIIQVFTIYSTVLYYDVIK